MDKTEHDNLPAIVSEYIDAVITTMRYRKKVRQEVRQELNDHFADALADCQNEEERDALAKSLIEGFGEAKLLGILLRRAKKRCRPLWRTMVVRMFQAVGAMFLLLLLYIGWFLTGKPVITTNYLDVLNRQVRPVADDSQNAWPYYKQAAEHYIHPEDFDTSLRRLSTLTQEERDVLNTWLDDNRPSLELIRQGSQKPYYWQTYGHGEEAGTEDLISILLPHLTDYRRMSNLLCWQALIHAHEGDTAAAFGAVLEAYSFGQHLRGQNPTLIEQLVCISIETISIDTLRNLLNEYSQTLDVSILDAARKRFEERVSKGNFTISFGSEKLFMYDELQRSFTQPRFGKSHLYVHRLNEVHEIFNPPVLLVRTADNKESSAGTVLAEDDVVWRMARLYFHILFTHPGRDDTNRQIEDIMADLEQKATLTPASIKAQGLDINEKINAAGRNNLLINLVTPAFSKVVERSYRCRTDSIATLAILAIVQYEKTHGEYPDSLAAVVEAGLLETLLIDPFSDEPLVYRRTEDGFTLYSVGLNMTDNGGVRGKYSWADDGDAVFWPIAGGE